MTLFRSDKTKIAYRCSSAFIGGHFFFRPRVNNNLSIPERARSNKPLMSSLRLYRLIRVLAAPGDEVVPGQGVVVVEAMKMQNSEGVTGGAADGPAGSGGFPRV